MPGPGRPPKSQEGNDTQEQAFIDEFKSITNEAELQGYEEQNRKRIDDAELIVRDMFNRTWSKVFGRPYYQPITIVPQGQEMVSPDDGKGRTDPKSMGYKGFWEVLFSPKSSPDDPEDVTLGLNGVILQIQRNKPVILPGPYLEVCDHGTYPKYTQTPEQSRKIVSYIKFFPYTVLRQASEEEYNHMKRTGDRLTREAREREETILENQ